ncbi:exonuclease domain-containing protein [Mycobacterium sp.]|uniref:3'-5' exonuclease n=1 Tax=Mycobacterium sp. TaxID=1785 RepID=UPI0025F17528|nr:exonuclease domain-containing protein [Mycobacterium sp.]
MESTLDALLDTSAGTGGAVDALIGADRITVVDVETTGLYRTDRIVEIAMVTMDSAGNVTAELDSLVNPLRDTGPVWCHGITASMVANAPTFEDLADHVADRLEGSVVVAHNLRFDTRMLQQEFDRLGYVVDWGVGLDTLRATGCALGVACTEYDIPMEGAHRALFDARATAQLLLAVRDAFTTQCQPVKVSPLRSAPAERVLTRDGFANIAVDVPCLPALARGVHADHDVAPYVALLDQALADLQLTDAERAELTAIADDLGLSKLDQQRARREFLSGLVDAATEDGAVTDTELHHLCRVAALLDLDEELVTRRTNPLRLTHDSIKLAPGLNVCFTGDAVDDDGNRIDRESILKPEAIRYGLIPKKSFTKSCDLLIVADTASQSSKTMAARRYGTPVASLTDYRRALVSGAPLPVTRLAAAGVAQVCGKCGTAWVAARRSSNPLCQKCSASVEPIRAAVPLKSLRQLHSESVRAKSLPPVNETLVCSSCGKSWRRPRTRGRPPKRCPSCAPKLAVAQA